jgi:hypothetical protein
MIEWKWVRFVKERKMVSKVIFGLRGQLTFAEEKGQMAFAGQPALYLPHKFLARWLMEVEQALGVNGMALIQRSTAEQLHSMQSRLLKDASEWREASPIQRLEMGFALLRLEGWGHFEWEEITSSSGRIWTRNNTLAEAYLENMQRWMWPLRETPFCWLVSGRLQALVALASDLPMEQVRVTERACLTMGADRCSFRVEVG